MSSRMRRVALVAALAVGSAGLGAANASAALDPPCTGEAPTVTDDGLWLVRDQQATRLWSAETRELSWSPDGRFLAARVKTGETTWAIDVVDTLTPVVPVDALGGVLATVGLAPVPTKRLLEGSWPQMPTWSGDGRLVWNGDNEVLVYDPQAQRTRSVHRGVGAPGRSHAIVWDQGKLLLVDLDTLQATEVGSPDVQMMTPLALSPNDDRVYYGDFRSWGLPEGVDHTWTAYGLDLATGQTYDLGEATTPDVRWVGDRVLDLYFGTFNGYVAWQITSRPWNGTGQAVLSNGSRGVGGVTSDGTVVIEDYEQTAVIATNADGSNRRVLADDAEFAGAAGSTISYVQADDPAPGGSYLRPTGCAITGPNGAPRRVVRTADQGDHGTLIQGMAPSADGRTFAVVALRVFQPPPH